MNLINGIYILCYSIGIASAIWSTIAVFKKDRTTNSNKFNFLKLISFIFWIISFWSFYKQELVLKNITLAIILTLLGNFLFWWGRVTIKKRNFTLIFSENKPSELVTDGPYRYIRNPFYMSYILMYLSAIIVTRSPILILLFFVLTSIYYFAALNEENKFINSELKSPFENYKKSTGRFLPKIAIYHKTDSSHNLSA